MEKEIEIQQQRITKLLELAKGNPELRIIPMVDNEAVLGDEFAFWAATWGEPEIDEIWNDDQRIYFRSDDEEELVSDVIDNECFDLSMSDEEAEKKAKEIVAAYEWEKVIAVQIRAL